MLFASLGFRVIYRMGQQTIKGKNALILHEDQTDPFGILPEENLYNNNIDWNLDPKYQDVDYGFIA